MIPAIPISSAVRRRDVAHTYSRSGRCHAIGDPPLRTKPLREQTDKRHEDDAGPQPDANALSEYKLPKLRAQARHHETQDDEDRSNYVAVVKISLVEQRPCDYAASERHGALS